MRWSIGPFSLPRQYAPPTFVELERAEPPGRRHVRAAAQVAPSRRCGTKLAVSPPAAMSPAASSAASPSMISRLYGWSARRRSASSRSTLLAHERAGPRATIARIVSSILGEVVVAERAVGELEVVVEAVGDRRPDRVLRARGTAGVTAWASTCAVEWRSTWRPSSVRTSTGSTAASPAGTKERSRSSPSTRAAIAPGASALPTGSPSGSATVVPSGSAGSACVA